MAEYQVIKMALLAMAITLIVSQISTALIVCPPHFCENVTCPVIDKCPDGYALAPTFCGCCQRCVPVIRKYF